MRCRDGMEIKEINFFLIGAGENRIKSNHLIFRLKCREGIKKLIFLNFLLRRI